jgi:hypothetical protein
VIRITTLGLIAGLTCAIFGFSTNSAHALLFNWSFTTEAGSDNPGGVVSGTIDGLVEGLNGGAGLIVEVTSTPTGELVGVGWTFSFGPGFTVTGGLVTFADAQYIRATDHLFFSTDPSNNLFFPQLIDTTDGTPDWFTGVEPVVFTPVATQPVAVTEPGPIALFGLGLAGLGYLRRRRNA